MTRLAPLVAAAILAGCGTATPESVHQENLAARTDQLMRIAHVTRQGGDLQTAATMFERAARQAPDSAAALLEYAATLHDLAEYNQAALAYQRAIKIDARDARAHFGYGRTLLAMGRPSLAKEAFETAVAADPSQAAGYNGLGLARIGLGAFDAALQAFDAGLSIAPGDPALRTNRALCLAFAGRFAESTEVLTQLAAIPGATPRQRQNAALVFGLMGDPDQAARWARADLPPQAVAHNLKVYEELRALTPEARARRVLGIDETGPLPVTPGANSANPASAEKRL